MERDDIVIEAHGLGKAYLLAKRPSTGALRDKVAGLLTRRDHEDDLGDRMTWVLKDVDLRVREGEIYGIIGRNGSGKTTLLKILARVTAPTVGDARTIGRVAPLLQVGAGFHPMLTGRDNIALSGAILGMTAQEVDERFDEIVAFSEIGQYLDQPVKNYSSGMYARLAFSVSAFLPAEIMLVDEVLSVGDEEFRLKAQAHMKDALKDGRTVVYVGHGLDIVRELCSEALVLDDGRVVFEGGADAAADYYLGEVVGHPHS
jgi:lipopolysaccharide transport system ATP-binding protein